MRPKEDAAVFILFGQSNATGHNLPMEPGDRILRPLKNVFGLSRQDHPSPEIGELTWSGYTSCGMNLAEEQDNTYSLANCLAARWQKTVDEGIVPLPDLYIVHMSVGAQGVTEGFMWNPDYPEKFVPGALGTVDMALYPFALRVLSLLKSSFDKIGKNGKIIGLHWRGGEEDMTVSGDRLFATLEPTYDSLFDGFFRSVGESFPIVLHKLVCDGRADFMDPSGAYRRNMGYVNAVFEKMAQKNENISVFEPGQIPGYDPHTADHHVFMDDFVHYTKEVNQWVAGEILNRYMTTTGISGTEHK